MDQVLLYGTFGLLMFGPVAFGAVEAWAIFVVETGAILLTLLWFARQLFQHEITIHSNPVFAPMVTFAGLIVVQLVLRRSAYPHDTISEAALYCAYGMICFLVSQILRRSSQARKIALLIGIYGIAVAVFALLQGIAPNGKLYWLRVPQLGGRIYGPYVNHNHYAGLMEMLVPIPLVTSLSRLADERTRIAAGVAAAIMVGTVFLSGSRGGMLAIGLELALIAVILFRQQRTLKVAVSVAAFVVVLMSLLVWLGGKELTTKVSSISTEARGEISGGMRLSIDKDGLHMFRHRPILGWGLGTFPVVYPQFRSFYTNFFVNEAHNDYVQLLAEMGILGFATMVWLLVLVYRHAVRKIANWTGQMSGAVTLACTLGIAGILLHSLLDFNLQIPANAALFYVLCTVVAAPPLLQRVRRPKPVIPEEQEYVRASEVG
ncbi:MAG TPA: O-antigen ligase family protein [Dongiaceae bacterium]|nr:O-antigen ligase family protein [Dongiaceae bacterium]